MTQKLNFSTELEESLLNTVSKWLWLPTEIRSITTAIISQVFFLYYKFKGAYSNSEDKLNDLIESYPQNTERKKIAIVTGANTGIGYETARVLAKAGYKVILACRDETKAQKAIEKIRSSQDNNCEVEFYELDLLSLASVRQFATKFSAKDEYLDLLINNAGLMLLPQYSMSEDCFEAQYQVNYLAPFLLTHLLAPKLKNTPDSKIINLSSLAHYAAGDCDFTLINEKANYSPFANYAKAKAALIMCTSSFQEKLGSCGVQAFAVHPGVVATELLRHNPFVDFLAKYLIFFVFKTPLQGALTTLRVALTPSEILTKNLKSRYFSDELPMETYHLTRDSARQEAFWRDTCQTLSLSCDI